MENDTPFLAWVWVIIGFGIVFSGIILDIIKIIKERNKNG
jgi:hypothetical protein